MRTSLGLLARRAGASAGALAGAAATSAYHWPHLGITRAAAIGAFAVSAVAIQGRHLGAQIFARAVWFSALVLAGIDIVYGPPRELLPSLALAAGAGGALALAGRTGLDEATPAGSFAPVAFRSAFVAAMAMALADAATLLFYGVAWLEFGSISLPLVLGVTAALGAVGLFRLRAWGLLLCLATNVVVASTALTGLLAVGPAVAGVLAITAGLQAALLLPIARAALRGAGRPHRAETAQRGLDDAATRLRVANGTGSARSDVLDEEFEGAFEEDIEGVGRQRARAEPARARTLT